MNNKNLFDNPLWIKLASRRDDLLFVLLHYGNDLRSALPSVQKEFKNSERNLLRLERKLQKEGYILHY